MTLSEHENWRRHFQTVKRQIAFQIALGRRNQAIRRRLKLPHPVRRYLREPELQELVLQMREELDERAELFNRELFPISLKAAKALLEGRPLKKGWRKPDLRMTELVWRAHGRFAVGEESARETTVNVNQPTLIQEPGDGRALLELVRKERLRLEAEKNQKKPPIDTTAIEVGTS